MLLIYHNKTMKISFNRFKNYIQQPPLPLAPDAPIFFFFFFPLLPSPILTILILLATVPYTYPCLAWTVEEELPPEQTPISPCELAGRGMPF